MKTSTWFDLAYLATDLLGSTGRRMRYGLSVVRNMYYLLRK